MSFVREPDLARIDGQILKLGQDEVREAELALCIVLSKLLEHLYLVGVEFELLLHNPAESCPWDLEARRSSPCRARWILCE